VSCGQSCCVLRCSVVFRPITVGTTSKHDPRIKCGSIKKENELGCRSVGAWRTLIIIIMLRNKSYYKVALIMAMCYWRMAIVFLSFFLGNFCAYYLVWCHTWWLCCATLTLASTSQVRHGILFGTCRVAPFSTRALNRALLCSVQQSPWQHGKQRMLTKITIENYCNKFTTHNFFLQQFHHTIKQVWQ